MKEESSEVQIRNHCFKGKVERLKGKAVLFHL
jgi:hypothetical protein